MSVTLASEYVVESCCYDGCNVQWAFTRAYFRTVRNNGAWWYCPNGHRQHYSGKTDEQKLRDSQARETALKDQLSAAIRDADETRVALLRDRERFANGVCPCCNRSFDNVRRHMATQHPDYDTTKVHADRREYTCSCHATFTTLRGLRIHQGHQRRAGWDAPNVPKWQAHLTRT